MCCKNKTLVINWIYSYNSLKCNFFSVADERSEARVFFFGKPSMASLMSMVNARS